MSSWRRLKFPARTVTSHVHTYSVASVLCAAVFFLKKKKRSPSFYFSFFVQHLLLEFSGSPRRFVFLMASLQLDVKTIWMASSSTTHTQKKTGLKETARWRSLNSVATAAAGKQAAILDAKLVTPVPTALVCVERRRYPNIKYRSREMRKFSSYSTCSSIKKNFFFRS